MISHIIDQNEYHVFQEGASESTLALKNFKKPCDICKIIQNGNQTHNQHMFSFKVWRKSIMARYIIDCLIVIGIAIMIQLLLTDFLEYPIKITQANDTLEAAQFQINQNASALTDEQYDAFFAQGVQADIDLRSNFLI